MKRPTARRATEQLAYFEEMKAAITAVYAEAIRSAVPEEKYQPEETTDGYKDNPVVTRYKQGFNAAIDTITANLKEKGLMQ